MKLSFAQLIFSYYKSKTLSKIYFIITEGKDSKLFAFEGSFLLLYKHKSKH